MPKGGWSLLVSLGVHATILLIVMYSRAPVPKTQEWLEVDLSAFELPKLTEPPKIEPPKEEPPKAEPAPIKSATPSVAAAPKIKSPTKSPKPPAASPVEASPSEGSAPSEGLPAEPAPAEVALPSNNGTLPPATKIGPGGKGLKLSTGDFFAIAGDLKKNPPKRGSGPSFSATEMTNGQSAVTAGNQKALGKLGGPFSKYLNSMHLQIHKEWADKVLISFAKLDADHALNKPKLEATLELVILADGTLESANVMRTSGEFRYDAAAQKAVFAAAPFPAPPKNLRSYLDKVYVRWSFFRDNRECIATLAQPYWITGPEEGTPASHDDEKAPTPSATSLVPTP